MYMKNKIKIKYIVLSIVVMVSLVVTSFIVAMGIQSGIDYVTTLIVLEQNDHYTKMQKNIFRLKSAVETLQDDMSTLEKKQLTKEETKSIKKQLRDLEEIGLNISRETGFYQEDTTVHIFFEPKDEIITYFDKTRNTPLYIDRFVRSAERGLFENVLTKQQRRIVIENYEFLKAEVESVYK